MKQRIYKFSIDFPVELYINQDREGVLRFLNHSWKEFEKETLKHEFVGVNENFQSVILFNNAILKIVQSIDEHRRAGIKEFEVIYSNEETIKKALKEVF